MRVMLISVLFFFQTICLGSVRVQGIVSNATGNELICTIVSTELSAKPVRVAIPMREGKFNHRLDLTGTKFLSFSDGSNYFGGFVQNGDSITIQYDQLKFDSTFAYSGIGKEKFEIAYAISQIRSIPRKHAAAARNAIYPVDCLFAKIDSLQELVTGQIARSLNQMDEESIMQLQGYLAANVLHAKFNGLVAIFGDSYHAILEKNRDKFNSGSVDKMRRLLVFDEDLYRSNFYVNAINAVMGIYLEENIQPQMTDFARHKYQYLSDMLPAKLRSPVIFLMLSSDITNNKGAIENSIFANASGLLSDSILRQNILDRLAGSVLIKAGLKAPEFSLMNLSGKKVDLASFSGKTVYLDFWFAACGPCHLLFKAIEPVKKYFQEDSRVVFLVVSVDGETEWRKAISKFGVKGYHAFTENKFRDHPIIRSYQVGAYPTTYIINPSGEFHSVSPSNNPEILKQQILDAMNVKGR